jgi:hypothetical protein
MSRILGVVLAALLLSGCSTRRIVDHALDVPSALTDADVELAVREAVETLRRPTGMPDPRYRTDPGFSRGEWSVEDPAPGSFKVVLRTMMYGRNYLPKHRILRVGVWYSAQGVRTRIVGASGDLDFDGERVHRTALKWQKILDERIASELAHVARRKGKRG